MSMTCRQCDTCKKPCKDQWDNESPCPKYVCGDILTELFRLQAELSAKYGFDLEKAQTDDLYCGQWLHDYITAMTSELEELRDCIYWKHWHREAREGRRFLLRDREHAKVEIIDLLFFWMSMAQCVGLTVEDVADLYRKKLGVNHHRRDEDMTSEQAHETEVD